MLGHNTLVHVQRATPDDAAGIATLHDQAQREAVRLARRRADPKAASGAARTRGSGPCASGSLGESSWRITLKLASGDHRPWVATLADRTVGFVCGGPSRDADAPPAIGELYVTDFDFDDGQGAGARALLHHACRDLRVHGFEVATVWVVARDQCTRDLLEDDGWTRDETWRRDRIAGVPLLEYRYRKVLT